MPTCVEARNALKIISVAQFMKTVRHSSNDVDDSQFLANYLNSLEDTPDNDGDARPAEEVVVSEGTGPELDAIDELNVYHLAGILLTVD